MSNPTIIELSVGIDIGNTNTKINIANKYHFTFANKIILSGQLPSLDLAYLNLNQAILQEIHYPKIQNRSSLTTSKERPLLNPRMMNLIEYIPSLNDELSLPVVTYNDLTDVKLYALLTTDSVFLSVSCVISITDRDQIIKAIIKFLKLKKYHSKIWNTPTILALTSLVSLENLKHLGTDRALKIYYLSQLPGSGYKISLGFGTAFTVEVIKDNKFIESIIIPGLALQLTSLANKTVQLPQINQEEIQEILNDNNKFSTKYAITHGVLHIFFSIIANLIYTYHPENIICTGGDALIIQNYCKMHGINLNFLPNLESSILVSLTNNCHKNV